VTREEIINAARIEHDKICSCDPKYLMSCLKLAQAILNTTKVKRDDSAT
jgi:hypothetical protein